MNPTLKALTGSIPHVLTTFLMTLIGMLSATHEPVTTGLIVSLVPAAAVAALRVAEAAAKTPPKG